uniref:hypothetical protein n=1 Tax=Acinetobacter variabilis TaxID=70346 RepID=UPI001330A8E0
GIRSTTYPSYALNLAQLGALCISNLCATKPFDSIKIDSEKNSLDFWYKAVAKTYVPTEKMYKGDYSLAYTILDCATNTLATKSYVSYSAKGSVKESETVEVPLFEPIVPDTIGELFIKLCTPDSTSPVSIDQKNKQIVL